MNTIKNFIFAVCLVISGLSTSYAAIVNEVEPNNLTTAQLVHVGDEVHGVMSGKLASGLTDQDYFKFVPPVSGKFTITVTASSGYGMAVSLLDGSRMPIFAESYPTNGSSGIQTWSVGADSVDYTGAIVKGSGAVTFVIPTNTVKTVTNGISSPDPITYNADGSIYFYMRAAQNYPADPYHLPTPLPVNLAQPYIVTITDAAPLVEMTIEKEGEYTFSFATGTGNGTGEIFVNGTSVGTFTQSTLANNEYVIGMLKVGDKLRITMNSQEAANISPIDEQSWGLSYTGVSIVLHVQDPLLYTQAEYDGNYDTGYTTGFNAKVCPFDQASIDTAYTKGFDAKVCDFNQSSVDTAYANGRTSRQSEIDICTGNVKTLQGDVSKAVADGVVNADAAYANGVAAGRAAVIAELAAQKVIDLAAATKTGYDEGYAKGVVDGVDSVPVSRELPAPTYTLADLEKEHQEGYTEGHDAGVKEEQDKHPSIATIIGGASFTKFMVNNARANNTKIDISLAVPNDVVFTDNNVKKVDITVTGRDGKSVTISGTTSCSMTQNGKLIK